jgi:undecaprenyl-diphosphatase
VSKPPLLSHKRARRAAETLGVAVISTRRHPHLDRLVPVVELAKGWPVWLTVAGGLSLTGTRGRRTAGHALLAALTASLTGQVVKRQVQRTRPRRVPWPKPAARPRVTYSFPSGHAATGAAFATTVVLEHGPVGLPLVGLAAVIGYSRVYGAVHFVTDVLGGAALGTGVAAGYWAVRKRADRTHPDVDASPADA